MNISESLKKIRKLKGLTQVDLAKKAGITQTSYSQIENGLNKPRKETLERIARALDIPIDVIYLMGIELEDVPAHKKEDFKHLFPTVKELLEKLLPMDTSEVIE